MTFSFKPGLSTLCDQIQAQLVLFHQKAFERHAPALLVILCDWISQPTSVKHSWCQISKCGGTLKYPLHNCVQLWAWLWPHHKTPCPPACVWALTREERSEWLLSEPRAKQLTPHLVSGLPPYWLLLKESLKIPSIKIQTVQRNLELQKLTSVGLWDFCLFVSFFLFLVFFSPWSGAVRLELNWENMTGVCGMFAETLGRVPSGHMA